MPRGASLVRALRSEPARFAWVAAALYALAIGWGLPHATGPDRIFPWGPDELAPLQPFGELLRLFRPSDTPFNPQYPLLQYFVQAAFAAPYALWLMATGGLQGVSDVYPYGFADPVRALAVFTVLTRIPTVLMAGATVAVAWWTARRLWGLTAGRFAALTTMLSLPMFYYGRTSNVDVPALLWLASGTAVFAVILEEGLTVRRAALLGLFAALSVGTKDAGYAFFAVMAAVILVRYAWRGRAEAEGRRDGLRALLAGAGVALVVYPLASGLVFSLPRFAAHVDFILRGTALPEGVTGPFYYSGEASASGYARLVGKTGRHVVEALGLPLVAASLIGVATTLRDRPRLALLLLPPIGILLGVIVPVRFVLFRFVLPMSYVLGLFAGPGLAGLLARAGQAGPFRRRTAWVAVAACFAWAGVRAADLTVQMWHDGRYALGAWLAEAIEPGDQVGFYGRGTRKLPRLPAEVSLRVMPGQLLPPEAGQIPADDPAIVLVIPQQDSEPVHEWTLPGETFRRLMDGSAGYRLAYEHRGGGWFGRRIVTYVDPPIRVFVRDRERTPP